MKHLFIFLLVFLPFLQFAQKSTIVLNARTPYCGGAKPTPEIAAGTIRSLGNQQLIIQYKKINQPQNEKWSSMMLVLDESGNWKGRLPKKCDIRIFLADQFLTISELKIKYALSDPKRFALKSDDEIEAWKSKPIYEKSFKDLQKNISIELLEACFTGLNPCYKYIGQKPR